MFELTDDWYGDLDADRARARVSDSPYPLWPEMPPGEEIGLGWTLLVSDRQEQLNEISAGIPGFQWSAAGILDPQVDRSLELEHQRFGVIFYVEGVNARSEQIAELTFDEVTLPVVQRPATFLEQRTPAPGVSGQLACWVTTDQADEGWLTAKHVARTSPGLSLVLAAGQCIDAAIVSDGQPGGGTPTNAVLPTVGMSVEIIGSHVWQAHILDVSSTLGSMRSSQFPLRFSFNVPGRPGDSGSMIRANPCDEPTGILTGAMRLDNGDEVGIGLAIHQLEIQMRMEIFV